MIKKIPINHATDALSKISSSELTDLSQVLECAFEDEKRLLKECIDLEELIYDCNDDDQKKDLIDFYLEKMKESDSTMKEYTNVLYGLIHRFQKTETQYRVYFYFLRESMNNKYYGKDSHDREMRLKS